MAGIILSVVGQAGADTQQLKTLPSLVGMLDGSGRTDPADLFLDVVRKYGFRPLDCPSSELLCVNRDVLRDFALPWGETAKIAVMRPDDDESEADRVLVFLAPGKGSENVFHIAGIENVNGGNDVLVTYISDHDLRSAYDRKGYISFGTSSTVDDEHSATGGAIPEEDEYVGKILVGLRRTGVVPGTSGIMVRRLVCVPDKEKDDLLRIFNSLPGDTFPFDIGSPRMENGCAYGTCDRIDGEIVLVDTYNGLASPCKPVAQLDYVEIRELVGDGIKKTRQSLLDDYAACCERGEAIEWSEDAFNLFRIEQTVREQDEKINGFSPVMELLRGMNTDD